MGLERGTHWRLGSRRVLVGSIALVMLAVAGCGSTTAASKPAAAAKINFAVVAPMTGSQAMLGKFISDPCFAATQEINKDGGILGHKVGCVLVDDTGDPADAVPNVTKALSTSSNLVGVVGIDSNVAATVVPIINTAQLPMVSSNGLSFFLNHYYKYFWRMTPPDIAEGAAMSLWAHKKGFTKIAVVLQNDIGDTGNQPGILAALKNEGITPLTNLTIPGDSSSYDSIVNSVRQTNPQVILMSADTQTMATFLSNYKQLNNGSVPAVITPTQVMSPDFFNAISKDLGSSYLASKVNFIGAYLNQQTPTYAAYLAAMGAAKVQNASTVASTGPIGSLYDGMNVEALAMIAANSTKGSVYDSYLPKVTMARPGAVVVHTFAQGVKELKAGHQIQYVGVVGPVSFDKYHNSNGWFASFSVNASQQTSQLGSIGPSELSAALK